MSAKYVRLANLLKKMIEENTGTSLKLPTEKELCTRYGVSRQTVRKALSVLMEENLIQKRQGSGSYTTGLLSEDGNNTIALLLSSDTEYSFPALISDIKSRFLPHGFQVEVYLTGGDVSKEREILLSLLSNPVRGIIAESCKSILPSPNASLYKELHDRSVSILFLFNNYPNLAEYPCIESDNYSGGYYFAQYLISHHHEKIAAIFQSESKLSIDRYFGYVSALYDLGKNFQDDQVCWFDSSDRFLLQKKQDTGFLAEFIQKRLGSCTAIICEDDEIAYWLIKELKYAGKSVPEDISVVCFHNTYLNDLSDTHITALAHKPHEMAYTTADKLLQLMKGFAISPEKLSFHLIERGSVRAPSFYI